ncbi:unnamed protein product [Brachionus calyciflorus]|uniref:Uncharacterized protein n=1 Tax=Brachionus calyciflorus TaxID=104777 RepID=A0A813V5D7_9BILA|nr:unnamed protein product [Brachionus calyciflorus]
MEIWLVVLMIKHNSDLLSGSWDNSLKVWNTVDGRVKISSTYHTLNVGQLAILPSGNFISESSAEINVWK